MPSTKYNQRVTRNIIIIAFHYFKIYQVTQSIDLMFTGVLKAFPNFITISKLAEILFVSGAILCANMKTTMSMTLIPGK